MKKLLFLIPLFMLASCGGSSDDNSDPTPTPTPSTSANTNKNEVVSGASAYVVNLEFPHVKGDGNSVISSHATSSGHNFSVEWDHTLRATRWICYSINRGNYSNNGNTRKKLWPDGDPWNYDPNIPMSEQQATYNELFKSYYPGSTTDYYQKGHLCPSADRLGTKDANEQTYYMTNIMPMVGLFNGGIWMMMENKLRGWLGDASKGTWSNYCDELYVCKGGTIDKADQIIGYTIESANVNGETTPHIGKHIIPRYYFMALLAKKDNTYKALGFWVEHLNEDHSTDLLGNYVVNIDKLEQLTGIDFFCNLPDDIENEVESTAQEVVKSNWGLK